MTGIGVNEAWKLKLVIVTETTLDMNVRVESGRPKFGEWVYDLRTNFGIRTVEVGIKQQGHSC